MNERCQMSYSDDNIIYGLGRDVADYDRVWEYEMRSVCRLKAMLSLLLVYATQKQ